jgi:Asp-tRNA(Asn)/Glu-tRNA(Gln) amidotransferase A subunit family amidase
MARGRIVQACEDIFRQYDGIVLPVTPLASPSKKQMTPELRAALLRLNTPASMASLPTLAVPVMLPDGSSGGLQICFPSMERLRLHEVLSIVCGQAVG